MPQLSCIGRDGSSATFTYEVEHREWSNPATWTYRVRSDPPPNNGDFFEFGLEELDSETVMVVAAENRRMLEYSAKGIPDALLPLISATLDRVVRSSPRWGKGGAVRRSDAATEYWKRLVHAGLAMHDETDDVYILDQRKRPNKSL